MRKRLPMATAITARSFTRAANQMDNIQFTPPFLLSSNHLNAIFFGVGRERENKKESEKERKGGMKIERRALSPFLYVYLSIYPSPNLFKNTFKCIKRGVHIKLSLSITCHVSKPRPRTRVSTAPHTCTHSNTQEHLNVSNGEPCTRHTQERQTQILALA